MVAAAGLAMPSVKRIDLGNDSDLLYFESFLELKEASNYLDSLNKELPWIRPVLKVYGRNCKQPRETCYVADEGLPTYKYSGYQPIVHKWDDFPALKSIANAVGCDFLASASCYWPFSDTSNTQSVVSVPCFFPPLVFQSILKVLEQTQWVADRYGNGNDYAAWHADDEKLYGPSPTIASVTLGEEREFLIRRKGFRKALVNNEKQSLEDRRVLQSKHAHRHFDMLIADSARQSCKVKRKACSLATECATLESRSLQEPRRELYSFMLKHGSLFVMQGYTQRDWEHSVPKRKRANGLRINLTFRYILN